MKKTSLALVLVSLVATPALANPKKINLSEYKTVAVQPVLAASNTRGLFESQLAAAASTLTISADRGAAARKTSAKLEGGSGFGFAGKAQAADVLLLNIGTTIGMLPTTMNIDPAAAKQRIPQFQAALTAVKGKVAAEVVKAIELALAAADAGDFQTTTKALLVAMALSADSIRKGSERPHGYMATGLYVGLATMFIAAGQPTQPLADIAVPLVAYLKQDAVLGGADRKVAAQLEIIAGELVAPAPSLDKTLAAIEAMNAVKPD
jgi:hypothetical protein